MDWVDRVENLLASGGAIGVQVLNVLSLTGRCKFHLNRDDNDQSLVPMRALCQIRRLTEVTFDPGRQRTERCRFSRIQRHKCDSCPVGRRGCTVSEDLHDGLLVEKRLCICNPYPALLVQG